MQTGLIPNAHNDLVTDAAYDFYGLRLATSGLDQRSAVVFVEQVGIPHRVSPGSKSGAWMRIRGHGHLYMTGRYVPMLLLDYPVPSIGSDSFA